MLSLPTALCLVGVPLRPLAVALAMAARHEPEVNACSGAPGGCQASDLFTIHALPTTTATSDTSDTSDTIDTNDTNREPVTC